MKLESKKQSSDRTAARMCQQVVQGPVKGRHGKTWRCVLLLKVWRSKISLPAQRGAHPAVGALKGERINGPFMRVQERACWCTSERLIN